jgi:hypothetical protein
LQSESYRKQHTVRICQHYDSGSISAAEPEECRESARPRGREMMGFAVLHPSYRSISIRQVGKAKKSRHGTGNPLYTFRQFCERRNGACNTENLGRLSSRSALASGGIVCLGGATRAAGPHALCRGWSRRAALGPLNPDQHHRRDHRRRGARTLSEPPHRSRRERHRLAPLRARPHGFRV